MVGCASLRFAVRVRRNGATKNGTDGRVAFLSELIEKFSFFKGFSVLFCSFAIINGVPAKNLAGTEVRFSMESIVLALGLSKAYVTRVGINHGLPRRNNTR